jgi:hypothetical protein
MGRGLRNQSIYGKFMSRRLIIFKLKRSLKDEE